MSFVPYVIEQTSRGERSYDIYSRLLNDRIIFLGEEVTERKEADTALEAKLKEYVSNAMPLQLLGRKSQRPT